MSGWRSAGPPWFRSGVQRVNRSVMGPAIGIVVGTAAAQAMVVLASPILTRLYSPSEYGAFAAAASVLSILGSVACLTFDFAIPLPRSTHFAAAVATVCLVVAISLSIGTGTILLLAGPAIHELLGGNHLEPVLPLLAVGVASAGMIAVGIAWAIRRKAYREIVLNRLTQSGVVVFAQIGLGLLRFGAPGLVIGMIAGSVAAALRLAWVVWRDDGVAFRRLRPTRLRSAARRYRRFPLLSAPSVLLNTLGIEIPLLVVVLLYGSESGGHMSLAIRMIALPVTLVSTAIGQVYFAEAARMARDHPTALRALFWRNTRTLAAVAIVPFLLAMVVAPLIFGPLFGAEWQEAGIFVAILAPMYYCQFVARPTGSTLDVLERQDLGLLREVTRLVLTGLAVVAAVTRDLSSLEAVAAMSIAGCATYILFGFLSWRAITVRLRGMEVAAS